MDGRNGKDLESESLEIRKTIIIIALRQNEVRISRTRVTQWMKSESSNEVGADV